MRIPPHSLPILGATVALALAGLPAADAQPTPPLLEGIEVQARGPIHEAFAQPVEPRPEAAPLVPQAPPEPVPEEPPPQQPAGDNAQWIGGYWSWDADRNEFLWVSGVYRNAPPGQRYVSGYWEQTPDGWRWVPGFWAPEAQPEVPYLPQPPALLDVGPSVPPPDDNSVYAPGVWVYRETRYVWQPGYWVACRPGLVWTPAQYSWTPSGCVFVPGYWDYPLEDRGLLFAPVAFTRPLWRTPGWVYRPSYVVGYRPLLDALFVRPGWRHYYYGDYYGRGYAGRGFQPWYAYGASRHDPLYSYYRWQNRGNPGWQAGLRQVYVDRAAGRAPLPPRTLAQQTAGRGAVVVTPLSRYRPATGRLTTVTAARLSVQKANAQSIRQVAVVRSRTERAVVGGRPGGAAPAGRSLRLPAHASVGPRVTPPPPPRSGGGSGAPRVVTPVAPKATAPSRIREGFVNPRGSGPPKGAAVTPRTPAVQPRGAVAQPRIQQAQYRPPSNPTRAAAAPARVTSAAPKQYRAAAAPVRVAAAPRPQPAPQVRSANYRSAPRPAARAAAQPAPRQAARPAPRPAPRPAARPAPRPASGGGNHNSTAHAKGHR